MSGRYTDMSVLPVGTKFFVENGCWDGEIIEEDGVKKVHVLETGRKFPATVINGDHYLDITIKE